MATLSVYCGGRGKKKKKRAKLRWRGASGRGGKKGGVTSFMQHSFLENRRLKQKMGKKGEGKRFETMLFQKKGRKKGKEPGTFLYSPMMRGKKRKKPIWGEKRVEASRPICSTGGGERKRKRGGGGGGSQKRQPA